MKLVDHQSGNDETTSAVTVLREGQDRFVAIWGQMGATWGIPRTMAEIHALLFITGESMCTDEIMERLGISRGSASMSLKSLLEWGIVVRTHKRGDRKEYFTAEQDVWQLFRTIIRERKRREIDPALMSLYECRDLTADVSGSGSGKTPDKKSVVKRRRRRKNADATALDTLVGDHNARIDEMIEFLELVDHLADKFASPNGKGLRAAVGLLGKVV